MCCEKTITLSIALTRGNKKSGQFHPTESLPEGRQTMYSLAPALPAARTTAAGKQFNAIGKVPNLYGHSRLPEKILASSGK